VLLPLESPNVFEFIVRCLKYKELKGHKAFRRAEPKKSNRIKILSEKRILKERKNVMDVLKRNFERERIQVSNEMIYRERFGESL